MGKPSNPVGYDNRRISQLLMAQKVAQSQMLHDAFDDLPDRNSRAGRIIERLQGLLLCEFDVEMKRADGDFSAAKASAEQFFVRPETQGAHKP